MCVCASFAHTLIENSPVNARTRAHCCCHQRSRLPCVCARVCLRACAFALSSSCLYYTVGVCVCITTMPDYARFANGCECKISCPRARSSKTRDPSSVRLQQHSCMHTQTHTHTIRQQRWWLLFRSYLHTHTHRRPPMESEHMRCSRASHAHIRLLARTHAHTRSTAPTAPSATSRQSPQPKRFS